MDRIFLEKAKQIHINYNLSLRYKRQSYLFISLLSALIAILVSLVGQSDHSIIYVLVIFLFGLGCVPIWAALRKGKFDLFEPINIILIVYFFGYGLRALYLLKFPKESPTGWAFDNHLIGISLAYALIGVFFLLFGYYISLGKRLGRKIHYCIRGNFKQGAIGALLLVYSIGVSFRFYLIGQGAYLHFQASEAGVFHNIIYHLSSLAYFAFILITLIYYRQITSKERRSLLRFLWWTILAIEIFFAILKGSRGGLIFGVFLPILMIRHYTFKKLAWRAGLLLLAGFVFVYLPFMTTYRAMYQYDLQFRTSQVKNNPKLLIHLARDTYKHVSHLDFSDYLEATREDFMGRVSYLDALALIVRGTPGIMGFQYGKTIFLAFPALFIPRFIWADKPVVTLGREFGQKYWGNNPLNTTSVAITPMGEWYLNFHFFGIIFSMFLFGLLLRVVYTAFITHPSSIPFGLFFYVPIFYKLVIGTESNFAAVFAGLIQSLFIMYIIYLFIRGKNRGSSGSFKRSLCSNET